MTADEKDVALNRKLNKLLDERDGHISVQEESFVRLVQSERKKLRLKQWSQRTGKSEEELKNIIHSETGLRLSKQGWVTSPGHT